MVVICETLPGNGRYMRDNPAATMMSVIITNPASANEAPDLPSNLSRIPVSLSAVLPIGLSNRAYASSDSMNCSNENTILDSESDLRTKRR